MDCERVQELAPELALGIADGEERAEALRHLADCADCRRLLERLSEVSDELLTLAPVQEPPPRFEAGVLDRLEVAPRRRRRRLARVALTRVAPPVVAAAIAALALVAVYHDDRDLAERYRETLERADGRYFQASELVDPAGARAGTAFGYEGSPSWVMLIVDPGHREGISRAELVARDGERVPLAGFALDAASGSWGGTISTPLGEVAAIRLLGKRPGEVLKAYAP